MKTELEIPGRLSYSSLSTYMDCGEKWKLERGYKLNESTWFATVAGSAIHQITEYIDLAELGLYGGRIPSFKEEFDARLAVEAENGVEVKASGKKLVKMGKTGGPNKKDYEWWLVYGPICIENWINWKRETDWMLALLPDGTPGIEVSIKQPIGGDNHLGFIDRIYITPDGQIVVVDLKSGNVPKSILQLGVYRVGLEREHGLLADLGAYWMAGDGDLAGIRDLSHLTPEWVDAQYAMAWQGIRAGIFLPNISSMCSGCSVGAYCRANGGILSGEIPVRSKMMEKNLEAVASSS